MLKLLDLWKLWRQISNSRYTKVTPTRTTLKFPRPRDFIYYFKICENCANKIPILYRLKKHLWAEHARFGDLTEIVFHICRFCPSKIPILLTQKKHLPKEHRIVMHKKEDLAKVWTLSEEGVGGLGQMAQCLNLLREAFQTLKAGKLQTKQI